MHARFWLAAAAAGLVTGLGAGAHAGARASADVGMAFAQDHFGENTSPALSFGAQGFYTLDSVRLSLGAGGFRQSFDSLRLISDPWRFSTDLWGLLATAEYAFADKRAPIQPFVGANLGWSWYAYEWSREPQSGKQDGSGVLLGPHLGLRFLVVDAVAIELGARYLYARTARINYGDHFVEDHVAGMTVRLGAAVVF